MEGLKACWETVVTVAGILVAVVMILVLILTAFAVVGVTIEKLGQWATTV